MKVFRRVIGAKVGFMRTSQVVRARLFFGADTLLHRGIAGRDHDNHGLSESNER